MRTTSEQYAKSNSWRFDPTHQHIHLPGDRVYLDFSGKDERRLYFALLCTLADQVESSGECNPINVVFEALHQKAAPLAKKIRAAKRDEPFDRSTLYFLKPQDSSNIGIVNKQSPFDVVHKETGLLLPLTANSKQYTSYREKYLPLLRKLGGPELLAEAKYLKRNEKSHENLINHYTKLIAPYFEQEWKLLKQWIKVSKILGVVSLRFDPAGHPVVVETVPLPNTAENLLGRKYDQASQGDKATELSVVVANDTGLIEKQIDQHMDALVRSLSKLEMLLYGHPAEREKLYIKRSIRRSKPKDHGQSDTLTEAEFIQAIKSKDQPSRVCLVGDAGSGKSSLLDSVAYSLCHQKEINTVWQSQFVPFKVKLRFWNPTKHHELADLIQECVVGLPTASIKQILREGRAVLLIDGLDETRSDDGRHQQFLQWLNTQLGHDSYRHAHVIMSSRPWAVASSAFNAIGFEVQRLEPLSENEQHDYVHSFFEDVPDRKLPVIPPRSTFHRLQEFNKPQFLMLYCMAHAESESSDSDSMLDLIETALGHALKERSLEVEPGMAVLSHLAWACWESDSSSIQATHAHKVLGKANNAQGLLASYRIEEITRLFEELCDHSGVIQRTRSGFEFTDQLYLEHLAARYLADSASTNSLLQECVQQHVWNLAWEDVLDFAMRRLWHTEPKLAEQYVRWLLREIREGGDDIWHTLAVKAGTWAFACLQIKSIDRDLIDAIAVGALRAWRFNLKTRRSESGALLDRLHSVVHQLARIGHEAPFHTWVQDLNNEDPCSLLFSCAVSSLAELGTEDATQAIFNRIDQSDDLDILHAIAKAVAYSPYSCPLSLLRFFIKQNDPDIRSRVISGIESKKIVMPFDVLINLLREPCYVSKHYAMRHISEYPNDLKISHLVPCLSDNDAYIRESAAELIRELGIQAAYTFLKEFREAPSREFIQLLSDVGEVKSLKQIRDSCNSSDDGVRAECIAAICLNPDATVSEKTRLLLERSEDEADDVRLFSAKYAYKAEITAAIDIIVRLMHDKDYRVRDALLNSTQHIHPDLLIPHIVPLLLKSGTDAQMIAVKIFLTIDNASVQNCLIDFLDKLLRHLKNIDDIDACQATALYQMTGQDVDTFTNIVFGMIHGSDEGQTRKALRLLINLANKNRRFLDREIPRQDQISISDAINKQSPKQLSEMLLNRQHASRFDAVRLLTSTDRLEDITPLLIELLDDPDASVFEIASRTLSDNQCLEATSKLRQSLGNPNKEILVSAAYALTKLGDRTAVEPLINNLLEEATHLSTERSERFRFLFDSRRTITFILDRDDHIPRVVENLIAILENDKAILFELLGCYLKGIESQRLIRFCQIYLDEYLAKENGWTKVEMERYVAHAISYLGFVKSRASLPSITKLLMADQRTLKVTCISALVLILEDESLPIIMDLYHNIEDVDDDDEWDPVCTRKFIRTKLLEMNTPKSYACFVDLVKGGAWVDPRRLKKWSIQVNEKLLISSITEEFQESLEAARHIDYYCKNSPYTVFQNGRVELKSEHRLTTTFPNA